MTCILLMAAVLGIKAQDDPVRVGQADGVLPSEPAGKWMMAKLRVVGIAFELVENERERICKVAVPGEKLLGGALER